MLFDPKNIRNNLVRSIKFLNMESLEIVRDKIKLASERHNLNVRSGVRTAITAPRHNKILFERSFFIIVTDITLINTINSNNRSFINSRKRLKNAF